MGTARSSGRGDADLAAQVMGGGLRALRVVASSPVVERLGLRPWLNRAIFEGSKRGYGAVTALAANRSPAASKAAPLEKPKRPSLFSLHPTEEQVLMLETLARFREDHLRAQARAADDASELPTSVEEAWRELGMVEMLMPEAFGGYAEERSPLTVALVLEALAHGDAGMAWGLLASTSVALLLLDQGSDEQRAEYLPRFLGDDPLVAT